MVPVANVLYFFRHQNFRTVPCLQVFLFCLQTTKENVALPNIRYSNKVAMNLFL